MHPSEINIGQNEYRAYQLVELIANKRLRLSEKRRWNANNMSMSVESILLGLTMTPIYIDASNPESWFVLDGRKRLQSLYSFVNGDFSLTNLDFYHDFNGCKFHDLPYSLQSKLQEAIFTVYSINQGVPERVRLNLVLRIVPDLTNALDWEFKESLIDKSIIAELKSWTKGVDYEFAKKYFRPESDCHLVLEYLRLKYIEKEESEFNLHTNIEHVIFKLNENPMFNIEEWESGLRKLKYVFDREPWILNNTYLNKKTIPILINYFGSSMGHSNELRNEFKIKQFGSKWQQLFRDEDGKKLFKRSKVNAIYDRIDKLIIYDSEC